MTLAPTVVLREYERLLVHSERFALADAVRAVHESEHVLRAVHQLAEVLVEPPPASSSTTARSISSSSTCTSNAFIASNSAEKAPVTRGSKRLLLHDVADAVVRRIATAEALVPTFLGPSELLAFARALGELVHAPELKAFWVLELDADERDTADVFVRVLRSLEQCIAVLQAATATTAEVSTHIAGKRDHLARLLADAAEILATSHSQRLLQYQQQLDASIESYQVALQARPLCDAKQLEFAAQSIETSMAMMLLPHFEICRTITTASATVEGNAGFTSAERSKLVQFVYTATSLKDHSAGFDSVLGDSTAFIADVKLFERAASQDAFSVYSSALKLQFRECLDEELFQAYVRDWKNAKQAARTVASSAAFRASTERVEGLKTQILRLDRAVHMRSVTIWRCVEIRSKQVESSDDPMRTRLCHEVSLLFAEEGGAMDLIDSHLLFSFSPSA